MSAEDVSYRLNVTERVASVLQNVALILSTVQGTAPMHRDFGLPAELVDLPIPAAKARLTVAIKEALEEYEPRAALVGVRFGGDGVNGRLEPVVEVTISDAE